MTSNSANENQLSIHEAASLLKVSTKTLRRWEEKEVLVPERTEGKHRRYSYDSIMQLKKSKSVKKAQPRPKAPVPDLVSPIPNEVIASKVHIPATTPQQVFENYKSEENINEMPSPKDTRDKRFNKPFLGRALIFATILLFAATSVKAFAPHIQKLLTPNIDKEININPANILADTSTLQDITFTLNVPTNINANLTVDGNASASGNLDIGGNIAVAGTTNTIAGILTLTGNQLSSSGDLTIQPIGGGVRIGNTGIPIIDLTGGDLFVADQLEVGTSFALNEDTITDFTGAGIVLSNGTLTASISADQIINDSIVEVDLKVSNDPSSGKILAYDSDTGGFKWATDASGDTSPFVTTSNVVNLVTSTDNLTIGSAASLAKLAVDGDSNEIQLLVQGGATQTTNIFEIENSAAANLLTVDNSGNLTLASGADLAIGSIGLNDTASAIASGAFLIGTFDEFDNSNSTTVQGVLNDLDAVLSAAGSGDITSVVAGSGLTGGAVSGDATLDIGAGNGITVNANDIAIDLTVATDGLSSTITSGSGLEVLATGLTLLQGCTTGQVLKWNETNDSWECANDTGASFAVVNVENNDVAVGTNVDTLDFSTDFLLSASPANEANISVADDILNFTEFSDALTLDAATTIANNIAGDFSIDLTSTGDFLIKDSGVAVASFLDTGAITFAPTTGLVDFTGDVDISSQLAIGSQASITSNVSLYIDETSTITSGTAYGIQAITEADPAGASTAGYIGVYGEARLDTANSVTDLRGIEGRALVANGIAGTVTNLWGGRFWADAEDGTVSNAESVKALIPDVDTGSITTATGLRVSQGVKGAGTIGSQYGLLIDTLTNGTNNFAIATSNGNVVFNEFGDSAADFRVEGDTNANLLFVDASADRIGIGTAAPAARLDSLSTTEQLRLSYDGGGVNAASFTVSSTGVLNIDPLGATNQVTFGTGNLSIQGNSTPQINATNASIILQNATFNGTSGTINPIAISAEFSPVSGTLDLNALNVSPTINQTGTAVGNYTALNVNVTETAVLGTANYFARFGKGGVYSVVIDNSGNVGIGDTTPSAPLEVGNGTDSLRFSSVGDLTFVDIDGGSSITGPIGGALTIAAGAAQDLTLTGADDIIFDDAQVANLQLSDVDATLPNSNIGLVDAINDAYNAAVGTGLGVWDITSDVIHPGDLTDDLAIGGSTSSAPFFYDESAELLTLTNTTAGNSFVVNDVASDTTSFVIDASGNVVIGGTAPANSQKLSVLTNSGPVAGSAFDNIYSNYIFAPSADSASVVTGTNTVANTSGSSAVNFTGRIQAVEAQAYAGNTNASSVVSDLRGLYVSAYNQNANAVTNAYGIYDFYGLSGAGNITNAYGAYLSPFDSGAGTISNVYGLYIANVSVGGTTNSAIVTNAGNVIFNEGGDASTDFRVEGDTNADLIFADASADAVGIGRSAPAYRLDIAGVDGTSAFGVRSSDAGVLLLATPIAGDGGLWLQGLNSSGVETFRLASQSGDSFINQGDFGLGDTTPDYLLELSDSTNTPTFALSDDDIAHGLTTLAETDVFAHLTSLSTTAGGAQLTAISDTDAQALSIRGMIGSTDPTDTIPAIKLVGAKSNGTTGIADLGAAETVFQVANNDDAAALTILGDGKIGIGIAAPIYGLDVIGNQRVSNTSGATFGTLYFGNDVSRYLRGNSAEFQIGATLASQRFEGTGRATIESDAIDGTTALRLNARTSHTSGNILEISNAGTSSVAVGFNGNIGIGDLTPTEANLVIAGTADGTDALYLTAGDILVNNGDFDLLGGDFNITLDTADGASITSAAASTADALTVTSTGVGSDALQLTFTQSDDADATDTTAGLSLAGTSSSGDADTFLGVDIGNLTAGTATETALRIGSGWDNEIYFEKGSNDLQFRVTAPTGATRTVTIPALAADADFCFTTGNCAGAGGGITGSGNANRLAKFTSASAIGDSSFQDDGTTITLDNDVTLTNTNRTITDDGALFDLNLTLGDDANADVVSALNIDVTSAATGDADELYGININNLSTLSANVIESAIRIGEDWQNVFEFEGATLDGNDYYVTVSDPGADVTVNLPTGVSGDFCFSSGNCAGGAGGSKWTDSGTTVYLTDTTDELVLGGTTPLSSSKFSIDGDADQIQLTVQGNGTQIANLAVFENSAGTDLLSISGAGLLTQSGTATDVTVTNSGLNQTFTAAAGATSVSANQYGFFNLTDLTGSNGGANSIVGIATRARTSQSAGNIGNIYGLQSIADMTGAGTTTQLIGLSTNVGTGSTGGASNGIGLNVDSPFQNSSGVITSTYGVLINNQGLAATSTATALSIVSQTGATTNYAIRTNSGNIVFNEGGDASTDFRVEGDTDANLFVVDASVDAIGIGTATPDTNSQLVITRANDTNYDVLIGDSGTTGDPNLTFNITGVSYAIGIDNSDNDSFKISRTSTLGTNDALTITTGGNVGIADASPDYLLELFDATTTPTFALSDDDIAHGVTTLAETDVFAHLTSFSTTDGGAQLTGLADNVNTAQALSIRGILGNTPDDTVPAIKLVGTKGSGTGIVDLAAAETVFQVANNDDAAALTILGDGKIGIGDTTPSYLLDINTSAVGADFTGLNIQNTDNTNTASRSIQRIATGGSSAGDALIDFSATGEQDWTVGISNQDSNKFRISASSALTVSNFLTLDARATTSGVSANAINSLASTIASAATAEYTTLTVTPALITLTGTTAVTTAMDANIIGAPTIADDDATQIAISNANTLTINGAPVASGTTGTAITNTAALRINSTDVTTGSGVVTNAFGIFSTAPTGATNMYAAGFDGNLFFEEGTNDLTLAITAPTGASRTVTIPALSADADFCLSTGNCAGGAGGSKWTDSGDVTYLTSTTDDLAVGGSTVLASMFGIDESAGNFYFGYDNSANPTFNFEATDADAGEFGFNTNDAFYFSNANVGVGTIDPKGKFSVGGFNDGDSIDIYSPGNNALALQSTLDSGALGNGGNNGIISLQPLGGFVGLGNASPDYSFEISDSTFSPVLALSDDDVAHGLTTLAQTDVFAHLTSLSSTAGGVQLTTISDTDAQALHIRGVIGSTDPTDTTPAVKLVGAKSNGTTGTADLGAAETVFQVANNDDAAALTITGNGNLGFGDTTPTEANVVIAGTADGTDALYLTAGDILVADGDFDLLGGDFNVGLNAADSALISNAGSTGVAGALEIFNTSAAGNVGDVDGASINLVLTQYADDGDTDTRTAFDIYAENNATDAGTDDNIFGIRVQNLGGSNNADGTEYAIYQTGTGWDFGLFVEDAAHFNSTLNIASTLDARGDISDSTGNLTLNDAVDISGITTVTGNINANGGIDVDDIFVVADGGAVTANTDVDLVLASSENFAITTTTPTVDVIAANLGTSTTDGVDGLQLTFGTSNASGNAIDITPTFAGGATDALTYNVIDIDAFSPTNGAGTDTVKAINIGNLTDPGATITSTALGIGSGFDNDIFFEKGSNDLQLRVTAPTGASRTVTIPALSADADFCFSTGNCAGGAGGSKWTDSGTTIYLTDTTDELVLGGSSPLSSSKFSIDGDADQTQLLIQGNATQTSLLAIFENSSGTDSVTINDSGAINVIDYLAIGGSQIVDSTSTTAIFAGHTSWNSIDIGDQTTTKTIDIGGVTASAADTINIATNNTSADVITIGNTHASTTVAITGGDDYSLAATGVLTLSASAAQTTAIVATDTDYTNFASIGDNNITGTAWSALATAGALTLDASSTVALDGDTSITFTDNGALYGTFTQSGTTDLQVDVAGNDFIFAASDLVTVTGVEGSNVLTLTAGDQVISDGSLLITDDDDAVSFGVTNNTATTVGAGVNTAGVVDLSSTSLTTGNLLNLETTTSLTSGRVLNVGSTTTSASFSGALGYFEWLPGSSTTATGNLLTVNIGTNGTTTGDLFQVQDTGSDLFRVNESIITSALPHEFTSAGDVSMAYDLIFTNETSSKIQSRGPFTIEAGDSFESNPITLQVYNAGGVVVDGSTDQNTSTTGVLDINVNAGNAAVIGANIDFTQDTGAAAATDGTGLNINLTANDADGDVFGAIITGTATTNAAAGSYEALLKLVNVENTIGAVTDAILIDSTSGTDTDITDAIDVSDTNIVNALNIGANIILGTTGTIDFTNFDVASTGAITTGANGQDGQLTIYNELGGTDRTIIFNPSASQTEDIVYTLPVDNGAADNYVLTTDGNGVLNWEAVSGAGGISGSGTAGQIAFFDAAQNIISETSGFGWDATNNLFTITGATGQTTQQTQNITSTADGLTSGSLLTAGYVANSATANFTGNLAHVTSNRDNDLAQTLTDAGQLLDLTRTTTTNNASAVTNVTGAIAQITNLVTATSGTINDNSPLLEITQDADATGALLYLNANRTGNSNALLVEQSSGGTDVLSLQDDGDLAILGDLTVTGGDIVSAATTNLLNTSTLINFGDGAITGTIDIGGVTADGATTVNIATNATTADTIAIGNSNAATLVSITGGDDWSISNTGILTLSASAGQTTAIVATDTDYTNFASIGDNDITGTTFDLIGTDASIDFNDFDVTTDGIMTFNSDTAGDQITINPPAGDHQALVVTSGTTNLSTAGIIDLNIAAGNAAVVGADIDLTQNDGATAATEVIGQQITLRGNDADGNLSGLVINSASTATATTGTYEALIKLVNAEATAGAVTDGILIDSTSGTNADITDAIDVSDVNITNAINVDENFVLFNGIRAFEANATDVLTFEDTSGNDLCTITDSGATGSLNCTGNITGPTAGTVGYWARSGVVLSPATAGDDILLPDSDTIALGTGTDLTLTHNGTNSVIDNNTGELEVVSASNIRLSADNDTDDYIFLSTETNVPFIRTAGTTNLSIAPDGGTVNVVGDLDVSGGDITGAATTNLLNTSTLINFGDGAITGTIDIGGVTADGASTVNIATNATTGDVITIGNSATATTLALTGGDAWSISTGGVLTLSADGAQTSAIVATDTDYTNFADIADNNITGTTWSALATTSTLTLDAATSVQIDGDTSVVFQDGGTSYLTLTQSGTQDVQYDAAGNDHIFAASDLVTITGVEGSNVLTITAGDQVISDGSLLITDDDNATSFGVTNNTATTIGAGANTDGVIDFSSTTLTTGNLLNLETTTALTSGRVLNVTSTSTALTTGNLGRFDWSPGSATTATGDLFNINIGTNGTTTGDLFSVTDTGSDLFRVNETIITSALPHEFTSAGDVSMAYDLIFTNQTSSFIKSLGPLTIEAGESFESNPLTFAVYNAGGVVIDGSTDVNTSTTGVLDLNVNSLTANNVGLNVDYTVDSGASNGNAQYGGRINLTANDADGDLNGLLINSANTSVGAAATYVSLLTLNNDETAADSVTDFLKITTASTPDTTASDAIDVSDSDLFNAINVGQNFILGDGIRQFSPSSTVWVFQDTAGNDIASFTDAGTTGNLDITGTLMAGTSDAFTVGATGDIITTGGDITGANSETIDIGEADNGSVIFAAAGETNNNALELDLETNTYPTFESSTATIIGIDEDLQFVGAQTLSTSTGNLTLQAAGTGTIATIQLGAGGAGSTTPDFLGLDVKSDTGDPAGGAEGYMYYNTSDNKFRCYQNTGWTDCIAAGSSPLTSSGGIIDKTAATDRLRLQYGDAGDVQLQIDSTTNTVVPTADAFHIDWFSGATNTGVVTDGADAIMIEAEFGNGTANTNSGIHIDINPVNTPSGDETFYALNIDPLTGTAATERGIGVGPGWDTSVYLAGGTTGVEFVGTYTTGIDLSGATTTVDIILDDGAEITQPSDADIVITEGGFALNLDFAETTASTITYGSSAFLEFESTADGANAIKIDATAGGIDITSASSTDGEDIDITSTGTTGEIRITTASTTADAFRLFSSAGGIDIDSTNSTFAITNTADGAGDDLTIAQAGAFDASLLLTSAGTGTDAISITTTGTSGDIVIDGTAGTVIVDGGEAVADALLLRATGGTTATVHLTSNGTGTAAVDIDATGSGGDIDIDANDAISIDSASFSIDSTSASNMTVTGSGQSLTVAAAGGGAQSLVLSSAGTGANAISLTASDAAGQIFVDAGTTDKTADAVRLDVDVNSASVDGLYIDLDVGTALSAGEIISGAHLDVAGNGSDDSGSFLYGLLLTGDIASTGTVKGINASGSFDTGIDLSGATTTTDLILDDGATIAQTSDNDIDIVENSLTWNIDFGETTASTITESSASSIEIESTANAAASLKFESTAGGIDIFASGASAGEDIDIVATGSSINLTSTEAANDAIVLTTSNAAGGIDITSASTTVDAIDISLATTTGLGFDIDANAITTGTVMDISSTSTAVTGSSTGLLGYFNWSPGSTTTATGDLFRLNIGANGNVDNILNITDAGSSLFKVSETAITSALPHSFTAAGDVSVAYDIQFTNQTASFIKTNAPLTIEAGESSENNNLTLKTYGTGKIVTDGGFSLGNQETLTDSTTPDVGGASHFIENNSTNRLVTNMTNGTVGQIVVIEVGTANLDFDCAGSEATLNCGNADITSAAGDMFYWIYDGTDWNLIEYLDLSAATQAAGTDLAEYFPTSESLESGDVVSIHSTQPVTMQKATISDDKRVVGVVSTQPGLTLGNQNGNESPVALVGRVPVKIAETSEAILPGDLISASPVLGRAQKLSGSGWVVGRALDSWNPGEGQDAITIFVNPIYVSGETADNSQFDSRLTTLENDFDLKVNASLTATDSGILASFEQVSSNTLSVLGDTVLSDTVINGVLNVGAMTFDNTDQSINAVGTLKIQSLALGNIELQGGLVIIDTQGNVVVNTITAQKYNVAGASAGTGTLVNGTTEVSITTTAVTANSLIFVTPKKALSYPMAVTEKVDGISFKIEVSQAEGQDIEFDWWIIEKTQ